jgi:hypothetical protein
LIVLACVITFIWPTWWNPFVGELPSISLADALKRLTQETFKTDYEGAIGTQERWCITHRLRSKNLIVIYKEMGTHGVTTSEELQIKVVGCTEALLFLYTGDQAEHFREARGELQPIVATDDSHQYDADIIRRVRAEVSAINAGPFGTEFGALYQLPNDPQP